MDQRLKQVLSRLAAFWKGLSKKKKTVAIAAFSGSLCVIALVVALTNTVHYTLLYAGLDPDEAGEVLTQVQTLNVPVKVKGSDIYVDSRKADEVKMKLAEAGYPRSTLSYDIFMKGTSWAMTDSDKQKLALYQLQDRLQDTIRTIPGVRSAQVTISGQDDSGYVLQTDQSDVTASVKLNLGAGTGLNSQQVRGIVLLVSRSVPGLQEKNVAVVDSDGTPLNDQTDSGDDGSLTLQKQAEQAVDDKVRTLLEPIFGSGNVRVASAVTMDFSSKTTNRTSYEPSGVTASQAAAASAAVSATADAAQYAGSTAALGVSGGGSSPASQPAGSLVNTVNEQISESGGRVAKLTVAVVVDSRSPAAAGQNADALQQTVAYAAGVDPQNVSVQLAMFASSGASSAAGGGAASVPLLWEVGAATALLAVLLFVVLSVLFARHRRRKRQEQAMLAAAAQPDEPAQPAPPKADIEKILTRDMAVMDSKRRLEQVTDERPELVAQLLKGWLKE